MQCIWQQCTGYSSRKVLEHSGIADRGIATLLICLKKRLQKFVIPSEGPRRQPTLHLNLLQLWLLFPMQIEVTRATGKMGSLSVKRPWPRGSVDVIASKSSCWPCFAKKYVHSAVGTWPRNLPSSFTFVAHWKEKLHIWHPCTGSSSGYLF